MDAAAALPVYLREHGQAQGPFDESDVRRRLHSGELGTDVMSWRAGEARWQSLGRRWGTRRRAPKPWFDLFFALLMVALAMLLAAPSWTFRLLLMQLQGPVVLWTLEGLLITPALAIVIVGSRRKWHLAEAPTLPYVLGCLVVVLCILVDVSLANFTAKLLADRPSEENALVSFDDVSHDILIRGAIGLRLPSDLKFMLKAHPDARKILIRSQGGRVAGAFLAADLISAAHLPLQVVNYCASACVSLWARVPEREMSPGSYLGLHQGHFDFAPGARFTAAARTEAAEKSEALTFAALEHAGFSKRLQEQRLSTPPQKILWVGAEGARADGVVFKLAAEPGWRVLY